MLTVLMATHNGTDTLGRTLASFCDLISPSGGWKLLIVNNASTDWTEELVLGFRHRLPLQYLVEPRLGKPHALNTGLEHVEGDLVVFTDDDVLPDPDWLVMWRSAVDRYPECSIFGGTIDLLFDRDRPGWLSGMQGLEESILFTSTEPLAEGPIPSDGRNIYGPNMAIRTSALLNGPRYDERFFVGPLGLMGEETELVQRLGLGGHKTCFIPGPRVRHIVQPGQLRWAWTLRRFYRFGKRHWVLGLRDPLPVAEIFHMPRYLVRRVAELAVGTPMALLSRDERRLFDHLWKLAFNLGIVVQARASQQELRSRNPVQPAPVTLDDRHVLELRRPHQRSLWRRTGKQIPHAPRRPFRAPLQQGDRGDGERGPAYPQRPLVSPERGRAAPPPP
jgi:glucosyl-dolichyl phosphate glucuronosyltransferase